MSILLNYSSPVASGLANVEKISVRLAGNGTNVGFSFGISDSIPSALNLAKIPADNLVLFLNIDSVVTSEGGGIKPVDFSNQTSFESPPQVTIRIDKVLNTTKLQDGCPDVGLFSYNDTARVWHEEINKPARDRSMDTEAECGYILEIDHFSRFAVVAKNSVSPPPPLLDNTQRYGIHSWNFGDWIHEEQ
jgi:hypothetical protein